MGKRINVSQELVEEPIDLSKLNTAASHYNKKVRKDRIVSQKKARQAQERVSKIRLTT